MHTLGFVFEPWKHEKSIADGPSILEYLNRIVDERHIRERIRFDSKVVGADWDSSAGTLDGDDGGQGKACEVDDDRALACTSARAIMIMTSPSTRNSRAARISRARSSTRNSGRRISTTRTRRSS